MVVEGKERRERKSECFFFLKKTEKIKNFKTLLLLTHAAARASPAHPLLDRVLAVLVVDAALLRVAQDVVGLVDVLEGVGGRRLESEIFFFRFGERKNR